MSNDGRICRRLIDRCLGNRGHVAALPGPVPSCVDLGRGAAIDMSGAMMRLSRPSDTRIVRKNARLEDRNAIGCHQPQAQGDATWHGLLAGGQPPAGLFVDPQQFLNVACRQSCDLHGRSKFGRCHVTPWRDFLALKSPPIRGNPFSGIRFQDQSIVPIPSGRQRLAQEHPLDLTAEHRARSPCSAGVGSLCSEPRDDDLQIFAWHDHGAIIGPIETLHERQQVVGQHIPRRRIKGGECFQHGTIIGPEDLKPVVR